MRLAVTVVLALSIGLLGGCGEEGDSPGASGSEGGGGGDTGGTGGSGGSGGEGGTGAGGTGGSAIRLDLGPIEFADCASGPGECVSIEVPIDWNDLDSERIPFFVRRFPAGGESRGQIWLLQGGPGSAGWALYDMQHYLEMVAPGFDVYVPDYRGVGHSLWLGCEGETPGQVSYNCQQGLMDRWGDRLAWFSTTGAALDLGHAIEAIRKPGEQVLIYSISYGTYLANRYLSLFPDQPDGVIFDSVCPAAGCDIRMDRNFNAVAEYVFELCAEDSTCRLKLGPDPWATFVATLERVDDGHCNLWGTQTREIVSMLVGYTVTFADLAPLGPAVAYRLDRCDQRDQAALAELVEVMWGSQAFASNVPTPGRADSEFLQRHVIYSEFWPDGLDLAQALEEVRELVVEVGILTTRARQLRYWNVPLYDVPEELQRWADTEVPLLFLNGDLDAQTHIDGLADLATTYTLPWQNFLRIPGGSHGTIFYSGPGSIDPRLPCGMELMVQFLENPRGTLDARCTETPVRLDFAGRSGLAAYFGTADLWENAGQNMARAALAAPSERVEKAMEQVRTLVRKGPGF